MYRPLRRLIRGALITFGMTCCAWGTAHAQEYVVLPEAGPVNRLGEAVRLPEPGGSSPLLPRAETFTTFNVFNSSGSTGGFSLDPADRQLSRLFFNTVYNGSANIDPAWSGSIAGCNPGSTSQDFRDRVLARLNFYRAMAGVPADVSLDANRTSDAQEAALMMYAENDIDHSPPANWDCFTANAGDAAGSSNLSIGNLGPTAVSSQVADNGGGNQAAGHRRWILLPELQTIGTGDVPGNSNSRRSVNVLHILPSSYPPRPDTRDDYVAWPPPGYVPWPLVYPRWSFSYPGADFGSASISMTRDGSNLGVTKLSPQYGYGENTLVWVPSGANANNGSSFEPDDEEDVYTVSITGVGGSGVPPSFSYTVRVFDPADRGTGEELPVVSGASAQDPGTIGNFSIDPVSFASGYEREICRAQEEDWFLGAESGLAGVIDETSASYSLVEGSGAASGDFAYHLATPVETVFQRGVEGFTLEDTFVPDAGGLLTFRSRLRYATADQVVRVQVSGDGGLGWKTVFEQTGASSNASYATRQVSLTPWAGRRIHVRFRYGLREEIESFSYYGGTGANFGFQVDDITLTGVTRLADCDIEDLGASTSFSFGTEDQGSYVLSARARVWDDYPGFDDAPVLRLDVIDTTDTDGDSVIDFHDNCQHEPNPGQENFDGDGEGDACDADDDNDGFDDDDDDFRLNAAASQDADGDGRPDAFHETCGPACRAASGLVEDTDDDNDGVSDGADNCPLHANPGQENHDSDPEGDACDLDADNDGIDNGSDPDPLNPRICGDSDSDTCDDCAVGRDRAFPASDFRPELDGPDLDEDGVCDAGDDDIDGDGWSNGGDNCPFHYDPANGAVCPPLPQPEFCVAIGSGSRLVPICF